MPVKKSLFKTLFLIFVAFLSYSLFSESVALSDLKDENLSWRVLERAESAYNEKNFSEATKLVQLAKINRDNESQLFVEILERALQPLPVQKVGNNIDNVLEILQERDAMDAVKVIKDIVRTHGQEYFDYNVNNILAYYRKYRIYPEADFLQAKIYRLEGELDIAQKTYLKAFENANQLDIPLVKYDILYELASLYKIQDKVDDYEKTLLLIVADDKNFYQNGTISPFLKSVIKNIKSGISLDKLFLLYRSDSYKQINAYFQLSDFYEAQKQYEKMLEVTTIGMIATVTSIEKVLKERELEYSYKNFNNIYNLATKYDDINQWCIKNKIYRGLYNFAFCLEMNDCISLCKEVLIANVVYSPEEYWTNKSKEELKKLNAN